MSDDCLFCKIIAGDVPSTSVFQDDDIYAFRDINPVAPTHVLIVPRRHISNLSDASDDDAGLLGHMMIAASRIAQTEKLTNGYRVLVNEGPDSGQEIFHLHLHVIGGKKLGRLG